ncbi:MAG: endolytic transglycosylase MltG [Candidatus Saccharibacteria bacterium]|nr:endolytic transglycosylase MltG [Candidatus Saccharibacteria bacterium]
MSEVNVQPEVKKSHQKPWFWVITVLASVIAVALTVALVSTFWYQQSLRPVDANSKQSIRFEITEGQGNSQIAKNLEKAHAIRSAAAMILYLKFEDKPTSLQAGTYVISPSYSVQKIVSHLESGKTDLFNVTILPGRTLSEIKADLQKYGYTSDEIEAAFKAKYDSPLLADKPADADLEGYIYPETFEMSSSGDLQYLFQSSFDTLYAKMQKDGLIDKFKAHNLNIHQAMTLASIIQKEASDPDDQPQIAQVFYTRLTSGMKLESDVTFHYAAKKLGVEPRVDLQSPYNTRLVAGLPPTPISNMNYSALQAVANPASGDYVYFIAGDDHKIYYGRTLEEHQDNIKKHCQKLCGNAS